MKQVFQNLRTGETNLVEVPRPSAVPGQVLIRSHASLVSAGTGRMMVELSGVPAACGYLAARREREQSVILNK